MTDTHPNPAAQTAAIRAIFAAFDWETGDRQGTLERIERIIDGDTYDRDLPPGHTLTADPLRAALQARADEWAQVTRNLQATGHDVAAVQVEACRAELADLIRP